MNLDALVRNRWMVAIRGGLAIAFGLAVLLWPGVTLSIVVVLFGVYAVLDGVWTVGTGTWTSTRFFDAWPVVLEGMVSVALGLLTLVRPFVPRQFIYVLAGWGIATGVLESLMSCRSRRSASSRAMLRSTRIPLSRWRRSQESTAAGPPSVAISTSVERLLEWISICSISASAVVPPIVSSRLRRPASTSAK